MQQISDKVIWNSVFLFISMKTFFYYSLPPFRKTLIVKTKQTFAERSYISVLFSHWSHPPAKKHIRHSWNNNRARKEAPFRDIIQN